MNKIKHYLLSLALVMSVSSGALLATAPSAGAACQGTDCINVGLKEVGDKSKPGQLTGLVKDIVNIMLFIVGAVSVLMIIFGGVRYVISGGDQSHVKAAKDTILYAIVGIVVAFLSYAIVNFVLTRL